jgi:hypothetical protein
LSWTVLFSVTIGTQQVALLKFFPNAIPTFVGAVRNTKLFDLWVPVMKLKCSHIAVVSTSLTPTTFVLYRHPFSF